MHAGGMFVVCQRLNLSRVQLRRERRGVDDVTTDGDVIVDTSLLTRHRLLEALCAVFRILC